MTLSRVAGSFCLRPFGPLATPGEKSSGIGVAASLVASLALLAAIGLADYTLGRELSLSSLYLIPILVVTWRISTRTGFAVACFAYAMWIGVNLHVETGYIRPESVFWEGLIKLGTALLFVALLSKLKQSLSREADLARRDFLTGLANRTAFYESVDVEMARCERFGRALSIAYIDLDNFKEVNDRLGHRAGDAALKAIADIMRSALRSTDVPARLGGDEFAVMLTEAHAGSGATVLHALRARLLEAMQRRGWPVTFSMGLATFSEMPGSVDDMIRQADKLMYRVKKDGKGDIREEVFGPTDALSGQAER